MIKIDTKLEKNVLKMLKISLLNNSSPENNIFDLFKNKKKIINDVQKVTKVYRQYKSVKENNLAWKILFFGKSLYRNIIPELNSFRKVE